VNRDSQAVVLLLAGVHVLRLVVSGDYLAFVNPWMRWPLLASGALLVLLAVRHVLQGWRRRRAQLDPGAGDEVDSPVSRTAWLVVTPILVTFLVAPGALGSHAAERRLAEVPEPPQYAAMNPLPAGDPVRVGLVDFIVRSRYDPAGSLAGRRIELLGFVTTGEAGGWHVTRFTMGCCAADATAYRVAVEGADAPPEETWVRVTGQWDSTTPRRPTLTADEVVVVDPPARQYE
jgi:uncharacterized repeat protein (TIGR03943 family)